MSWANVLMNPKHLDAFFDRRLGLDRLSLLELTLDREGRALRIRADLFRFPDRPSPRWEREANRAQVSMSLYDVEGLEICGWASTVDGVLSMQRTEPDGELAFEFAGSGVRIRGRCSLVRLDRLTAYIERE